MQTVDSRAFVTGGIASHVAQGRVLGLEIRVVVVPAAVAEPTNAAAELVEAAVHVDPQAAAD